MRATRWLVTAGLFFCGGLLPGQPDAFPERATRVVGEFTIEFSPGDEAYADELAAQLPEFRRRSVVEPATGLVLEHREEFLNRIAAQLAFKEPTKMMTTIYDTFTGMLGSGFTLPSHFALWRRPELLARVQAGEKIPGFSLDEAKGLTFNVEFKKKAAPQATVGEAAAASAPIDFWQNLPLPISIGKNADPATDISEGLKVVTGMIAMFQQSGGGSGSNPFVILHEATETAIVDSYLASSDRRWFCDGVANYVAFRTLEAVIGVEATKKYYDLDEQLQRHANKAESIDLERWPPSEDVKKNNYREDLNTANYAYATQVIAAICARHGDEILPKLFALIGETPKDRVSIKTVYGAFRQLTGEDMRNYVRLAPNRAKAELRKSGTP